LKRIAHLAWSGCETGFAKAIRRPTFFCGQPRSKVLKIMPPSDKPKPITAPPTFQDGAKPARTWTIKLDLDLIDSVQVNTQIDLAPDDNDPSAVVALLYSPRKLGAVLWECIKHQAAEKPVTREEFFKSLDGEALKNGWGALADSIVFFIQSWSPKLAEQTRELIEAEMQMVAAGTEQIIQTIRSSETDEALRKTVEDIGNRMRQELPAALEKSVENWQASSELPPARTRFAS
jgi:hypothetical protein